LHKQLFGFVVFDVGFEYLKTGPHRLHDCGFQGFQVFFLVFGQIRPVGNRNRKVKILTNDVLPHRVGDLLDVSDDQVEVPCGQCLRLVGQSLDVVLRNAAFVFAVLTGAITHLHHTCGQEVEGELSEFSQGGGEVYCLCLAANRGEVVLGEVGEVEAVCEVEVAQIIDPFLDEEV